MKVRTRNRPWWLLGKVGDRNNWHGIPWQRYKIIEDISHLNPSQQLEPTLTNKFKTKSPHVPGSTKPHPVKYPQDLKFFPHLSTFYNLERKRKNRFTVSDLSYDYKLGRAPSDGEFPVLMSMWLMAQEWKISIPISVTQLDVYWSDGFCSVLLLVGCTFVYFESIRLWIKHVTYWQRYTLTTSHSNNVTY